MRERARAPARARSPLSPDGRPAPPGEPAGDVRDPARRDAERPSSFEDLRAPLRLPLLSPALPGVDREDSALFPIVLLAEALHATCRVDELLLSGVEGMALV